MFLLSMKIESTMENDVPRRKSQTTERPSTEGAAPRGTVADGNAKKPPPIVVPAMRAAELTTDDDSSSSKGTTLRLRLHFLLSWRRSFDSEHREAPQASKRKPGGVSPSPITTSSSTSEDITAAEDFHMTLSLLALRDSAALLWRALWAQWAPLALLVGR